MKLVLDTNVVIDWLVFDDPYMNPLRSAVRDQRVAILTHAPAIDELRRVLAYKELKLDAAKQAAVLADYESQSERLAIDLSVLPKNFPRCRDPDDNHFLALAGLSPADALVSRDKAVLKLKKRSLAFGFSILNVQEMIAAL